MRALVEHLMRLGFHFHLWPEQINEPTEKCHHALSCVAKSRESDRFTRHHAAVGVGHCIPTELIRVSEHPLDRDYIPSDNWEPPQIEYILAEMMDGQWHSCPLCVTGEGQSQSHVPESDDLNPGQHSRRLSLTRYPEHLLSAAISILPCWCILIDGVELNVVLPDVSIQHHPSSVVDTCTLSAFLVKMPCDSAASEYV
jgi:hypothetical protein